MWADKGCRQGIMILSLETILLSKMGSFQLVGGGIAAFHPSRYGSLRSRSWHQRTPYPGFSQKGRETFRVERVKGQPDSRTSGWSGRRDSNPRPLRPERSALPGCATPRYQLLEGVHRSGTPEGTRTPNLLIRSQTLYPIELRVHCLAAGGKKATGWGRCQEFPSNSCSRGPKIPFA